MNFDRKPNSMTDLISELRQAFDENVVNVDFIEFLMQTYRSNLDEWQEYTKFDPFRYTRNLIDKGNGKYNLMILCWNKGQQSAIHDHSNSHCFMKILKGQLNEIRYDYPNDDDDDNNNNDKDTSFLREMSRRVLKTDDVCYINDKIGLHRICNASDTESAISLHLYCPPFDSCRIFNQANGRSKVCKLTFYSVFGTKNELKCV